MGSEDGNNIGKYKGMGEIRGTIYHFGYQIHHLGICIQLIENHTCSIKYRELT